MNLDSVEAFILAGGMSSRMGSPKGLLEVGGKRIMSHVVGVLLPLFPKVSVVSNRPEEVEEFGLPVLADRFRNCGPLGGVHSALSAAESHTTFVVSWDLPFLTADVVRSLSLRHGAGPVTIAATRTGLHPLCGFYNTSIVDAVEQRLQSQLLSMQLLVHDVNAKMLDVSGLSPHHPGVELFNVNTPADLERARRIAVQMRATRVGVASS